MIDQRTRYEREIDATLQQRRETGRELSKSAKDWRKWDEYCRLAGRYDDLQAHLDILHQAQRKALQ